MPLWESLISPASYPGEGVEQTIAVPSVLGRPRTGMWVLQERRHMCVTPQKEALHPQQPELDIKLEQEILPTYSAITTTMAVKGDSECIYM